MHGHGYGHGDCARAWQLGNVKVGADARHARITPYENMYFFNSS